VSSVVNRRVSELISGGDGIRVLMGIIINDYPITSRDGFAQGIVMDEAATSCQVWMNAQMDRLYEIAYELQHPPMIADAPTPQRYTISQAHYDTASDGSIDHNFLTRVLGKVPKWADLASIAQIVVMSVAFLTDKPGVYRTLTANHRKKVRYPKSIYHQIAWNILYLASRDNPQLVGPLMDIPIAPGPGFSTAHREEVYNHIAGETSAHKYLTLPRRDLIPPKSEFDI